MSSLLSHPEVMYWTAALTLAAATLMWAVSLVRRDASVVDPFWGPGFVLIACAAFALGSGFGPRRVMITLMTAAWGLRLGVYLLVRNVREQEEDRRYRAMREYWGDSFWWVSLVTVFLLQAVLMWIISLPIQVVSTATEPTRLGMFDALGVAVWAIGMFFEAVGDRQLRAFKADASNRGKVLDTGLWAYTRHPNYFGNAMIWWGIFLVALGVPGGATTIFSPLLMTFFLVKVSGVAMLERDIAERRPEYRDYIERTSAFLPLPPKTRPAPPPIGTNDS